MAGWQRPVYKKLVASELGEAGNTSGIVPVKSTEDYFGKPLVESTHTIKSLIVEFWHEDKSKIITTKVNYHVAETHNQQRHITGNILPAYKNAGAKVGDVVVFWRSTANEDDFKAELIKQNSRRWQEALDNGATFADPGGFLDLTPPGLAADQDAYSPDETGDYEVLSEIEETFTTIDFPTTRRKGRRKQSERYVTARSKARGDFVLRQQEYKCQINPTHTSFTTPVGLPYMEKHHLISMKFYEEFENELDDISNIVGLCPTCHRKIHLGVKNEVGKMLEILFDKHGQALGAAGFEISLADLYQKYGVT